MILQCQRNYSLGVRKELRREKNSKATYEPNFEYAKQTKETRPNKDLFIFA